MKGVHTLSVLNVAAVLSYSTNSENATLHRVSGKHVVWFGSGWYVAPSVQLLQVRSELAVGVVASSSPTLHCKSGLHGCEFLSSF